MFGLLGEGAHGKEAKIGQQGRNNHSLDKEALNSQSKLVWHELSFFHLILSFFILFFAIFCFSSLQILKILE